MRARIAISEKPRGSTFWLDHSLWPSTEPAFQP